jgi:hypothetical protein
MKRMAMKLGSAGAKALTTLAAANSVISNSSSVRRDSLVAATAISGAPTTTPAA